MILIIIVIVLIVFLIILRIVTISNNAEKSGLDKCPKCNKKMEIGVMGRYHCPYCGYKQGHGYF